MCHKLAFAINEACASTEFLSLINSQINGIATFINKHNNISAKMMKLQCTDFGSDRIKTLDKAIFTRWNSLLKALENHITFEPYSQLIIASGWYRAPLTAPKLLSSGDENIAAV